MRSTRGDLIREEEPAGGQRLQPLTWVPADERSTEERG